MRTYKPKFKDKRGKWKEVGKWWIELRDHNEIVRRFAGFPDKAATEALGQQIQKLISYKVAGLSPDPQMTRWLEQIPSKFQKRFIEVGLLDASRAEASKPLSEHISDFVATIQSRSAEKHAKQTKSYLMKIIQGCGFNFWSEVRASDIENYLGKLREKGLSIKTANYYIGTFRRFSLWMVREKRATEVPSIHTKRAPKYNARAFEQDEFQKLLEAAKRGPTLYGLSGYQRYLLYVLAVESGLRRGELKAITPASFDFKNNTVFVKGQNTKNSDDATQTISVGTAKLFKEHIANKMPNVILFELGLHTADMIRADCKAGSIEVENNRGKLNFHSLRHTCGTFLADKGVHPKTIQTIMRHKDINLTMGLYTHTLKGQVATAINSLPNFTKHKATGTE
ncbi:MAG: tyrosine-type recombinase/integrase [Planctomycetes bacterium]|nr:tyrosine-type recombinase/integrase [Planctomycetota bacterium]